MTSNSNTWNLFELPVSENSTKYFEYKKILEQSTSSPQTLSRYTFNIRDNDAFILPSQAFLHVRVKFTDPDKTTNLANANHYFALENGGRLFSEATYKISDRIIERVENLPDKQLVQNLLEYSQDFASTSASDQLWAPDTGLGGIDRAQYGTFTNVVTATTGITVPTARTITAVAGTLTTNAPDGLVTLTTTLAGGQVPSVNNDYNSGFDKRATLFQNSKIVNMRIPLSRIFGYCKSIQKVSTGVPHTIELVRSDISDILHTNTAIGTIAPFLYIDTIALWLPYLKPSLSTQLFVEKLLSSSGSQIHPMEYTNVYRLNAQTSNRVTWNLLSTTEKPTKVIVFARQDFTTRDVSRLQNKSIFKHLAMTRASLTVAGEKFPEYDFEMDFPGGDYNRLYHEMLRVSDKDYMDYNTGTQISYQDFGNLYPMICFDLRESSDKIFTVGQASDIIFRADLTVPVAAGNFAPTYSLFAVVYSERVLRLDVVSRSTRLDVV